MWQEEHKNWADGVPAGNETQETCTERTLLSSPPKNTSYVAVILIQ